jgi:enamine deaminase RidA (YjgF/YER057c/UK114 family)
MPIQHTNPPSLWAPGGFSHVSIASGARHIHIAGQVAFAADGALVGAGDIAAQTEQVYQNLKAALAAAGADFSHVVKFTTYVVDLTRERAAAIRAVRLRHLGEGPYPASTMVGVSALVDSALLIEIEAYAVLR